MADLSDFKRGKNVGARMVGGSVTKKNTELVGVVRSTVLKVMSAFENEEKIFSLKQISGRKQQLSHWDH